MTRAEVGTGVARRALDGRTQSVDDRHAADDDDDDDDDDGGHHAHTTLVNGPELGVTRTPQRAGRCVSTRILPLIGDAPRIIS